MHLRDIPEPFAIPTYAGIVGILRECPYKSPYSLPPKSMVMGRKSFGQDLADFYR